MARDESFGDKKIGEPFGGRTAHRWPKFTRSKLGRKLQFSCIEMLQNSTRFHALLFAGNLHDGGIQKIGKLVQRSHFDALVVAVGTMV